MKPNQRSKGSRKTEAEKYANELVGDGAGV